MRAETVTNKSKAIAIMFAGHIVATLLIQVPADAFSRVRQRDLLSLLPSWRFFAPRPASTDYHLFCRGTSHDGRVTEWIDIHPVHKRTLAQVIWFPEHREEKAVFDIMSELLHVFSAVDGETVNELSSYQLLEKLVIDRAQRHPDLQELQSYQFCIATSTGYDERGDVGIVFVSRRISAVEKV